MPPHSGIQLWLSPTQSCWMLSSRQPWISLLTFILVLPLILLLWHWLAFQSLQTRHLDSIKQFFRKVGQSNNCLHHLLPPRQDPVVTPHLCKPTVYPRPNLHTKRYCSTISYGLLNFQLSFLYIVCFGLFYLLTSHFIPDWCCPLANLLIGITSYLCRIFRTSCGIPPVRKICLMWLLKSRTDQNIASSLSTDKTECYAHVVVALRHITVISK